MVKLPHNIVSLTMRMCTLPALHHAFILVCASAVMHTTLELNFIRHQRLSVEMSTLVATAQH